MIELLDTLLTGVLIYSIVMLPVSLLIYATHDKWDD